MSGEQRDLDWTDAELEALIELEALRIMTAPTAARRREAFEKLRRLNRQRSPRQVARMETAQGLK